MNRHCHALIRRILGTVLLGVGSLAGGMLPATANECDLLAVDFFKSATIAKVKLCLQYSVDVNGRDKHDLTPLQ